MRADVLVVGAGPVGTAFALFALEQLGRERVVQLVDARPAPVAAAVGAHTGAHTGSHTGTRAGTLSDTRMIAVSAGSRTLLARAGLWHDDLGTPITRIHVSSRGQFGRTLIEAEDYGVPALGYVIPYSALVARCEKAIAAAGIGIRHETRVKTVAEAAGQVQCTLSNGDLIEARYLVHAEGGLFGEQETRPIERDYRQSALTGIVTVERFEPGCAWERFTAYGPLALLPTHQDGSAALALVWCDRPGDGQRRLALPDPAFLEELGAVFGNRLGRFLSIHQRALFPLGLSAQREIARGREFTIGNAAQTLHPVAGQGLNLGLRDAYTLATSLSEHFEDARAAAAQFTRRRRLDRGVTVGLTDLMPRVFASRLWPVAAGRGLALGALDLIAPARHLLARQMMDGQR